MRMLTDTGTREVGQSLGDALARLRRRREDAQHKIGVLEAELADLSKIEAALMTTVEMARRAGGAP